MISSSDVTFLSWPGRSVNPNFRQYQSYRGNECNIFVAWKFDQKQFQESLFAQPFKITFKSSSHLTLISCRCPVTLSTHTFSQYQFYKNDDKFTYCLKNH